MRIVSTLPFEIETHDDVWIPMADGVKLAARVWRPVGSEKNPVPAILEYIPYRRRDGTAERDAVTHPYFAGHGYAAVRVDIRGSGDSEGVLKGEYLRQEQDDALAILAWLERQPWCTGKVGMIGISWGGFNGLQIAARKPPQLKAVISLCSTDDRYADDIHFMGGCLLLDKFTWGATMFSFNAVPPDPESVGPRWRDMWRQRLEGSGFWIGDWIAHQRRDDFYKQGSVCEDWSAIECPVYAVGGWADGYSNAIFRLLHNLKGPKKGLVGPWAHKYPHFAKPGPQIGFLQECLRWWDKWLKGKETGIMEEPMLRAWIEDPLRPAAFNETKPGRWVAETQWPPAGQRYRNYGFARGRLGDAAPDVVTVSSPHTTGLASGKWCPYGSWADQALDQRQEMGGQVHFDSDILTGEIDVLGAPLLDLEVSTDRTNAMVAVTLCEVFPDGASARLSYGLLNLAHRDGHEQLAAVEPGKSCKVQIQLNEIGHRFGIGNRIRVSISNAYWPIAWPMPENGILSVHCAGSSLTLPTRNTNPHDARLRPFAEAEGTPPLAQTPLEPSRNTWDVAYDAMTDETILTRINEDGLHHIEGINLDVGLFTEYRFTIKPDDPLSARLDTHYIRRYRRTGWDVRVETRITVTSTRDEFRVEATLEAKEGSRVEMARSFDVSVPRDLC